MVLTIDGLTVPLMETPFGPVPSLSGSDYLALQWTLQEAVIGSLDGFREAIETGEEFSIYPLVARRPESDDDLPSARQRWKELTGGDLGDDVYVLYVSFGAPRFVIPRKTLVELVDRISAMRQAAAKPPLPWLFRPHPIWHAPAEGEEAAVRQLERQAAALEATVEALRTPDIAAREAAQRRFLLIELDALGMLSDERHAEKRTWLEKWNLPLTLGYLDAAQSMHRYFESAGRKRHFPDARDEPVLGSRVSLDWFRKPQRVPAGVDEDDWLGFCERTLADSVVTGYEGILLTRWGGPWHEVAWRRDDAKHPAVVRARVRSSSSS